MKSLNEFPYGIKRIQSFHERHCVPVGVEFHPKEVATIGADGDSEAKVVSVMQTQGKLGELRIFSLFRTVQIEINTVEELESLFLDS